MLEKNHILPWVWPLVWNIFVALGLNKFSDSSGFLANKFLGCSWTFPEDSSGFDSEILNSPLLFAGLRKVGGPVNGSGITNGFVFSEGFWKGPYNFKAD